MPQQFDVFLSHSSSDKDWVRQLKKDLSDYKNSAHNNISAWLDEEQILPGENFAMAIEKALENSRCMVSHRST